MLLHNPDLYNGWLFMTLVGIMSDKVRSPTIRNALSARQSGFWDVQVGTKKP
jgi:hypothetical protein